MSERQLPEGALIKVEMEVRLPVAATYDQVEEWLNTGVASMGSIRSDNPLISEPVEAFGTFGLSWDATGFIGQEVRFNHQDLGGGRTQCQVRYERTRTPETSP